MLLAIFFSAAYAAEPALSVRQLHFQGIFANHAGDRTVYCLLGVGFIRAPRSDNEVQVIEAWIADHPDAEVVPVDTPAGGLQYVWIRSGDDFLNIALIREGVFSGGVMVDPAEMFAALPPDAGVQPAEIPRRLISEEQYEGFKQRLLDAQELARTERKGIWSDQYKQLREEEGIE